MTAVEWLIEQMLVNNYISKKQLENCNTWLTHEAKEIERKQIIDAYDDGNYAYGMGVKEPEQYYNETYKNK